MACFPGCTCCGCCPASFHRRLKKAIPILSILSKLLSIIIYLVDVGTDTYSARQHLHNDDTFWGGVTVASIVAPMIIATIGTSFLIVESERSLLVRCLLVIATIACTPIIPVGWMVMTLVDSINIYHNNRKKNNSSKSNGNGNYYGINRHDNNQDEINQDNNNQNGNSQDDNNQVDNNQGNNNQDGNSLNKNKQGYINIGFINQDEDNQDNNQVGNNNSNQNENNQGDNLINVIRNQGDGNNKHHNNDYNNNDELIIALFGAPLIKLCEAMTESFSQAGLQIYIVFQAISNNKVIEDWQYITIAASLIALAYSISMNYYIDETSIKFKAGVFLTVLLVAISRLMVCSIYSTVLKPLWFVPILTEVVAYIVLALVNNKCSRWKSMSKKSQYFIITLVSAINFVFAIGGCFISTAVPQAITVT
ncbi:unnamed protein product, partial [Meganyctiphanes norvegica]